MSNTENKTLTISSIRRIHGRAVLTLSNGEIITMPRAMLRERPYKTGMPFDHEAFDTFIRERSYAFALEKAIAQLAVRARTEKEIVDCLHNNAYPENTIAKVMARLHDAGYINDAQFAEQWTSSRTTKGLGTRRIRMELHRKGINPQQIDQALESIDEGILMDSALKAAQKALRGKDISSPTDRQKIIAALARRGYDFSLAKRALQVLIESE